MRSFADYRKHQLRESLNKLSARGSSTALFEVLKLDLMETVVLPELLTESVIARNDFNHFRKDFQIHGRHVVETVCENAKLRFYDVLLQEADATATSAVNPSTALRMLRDELKGKISQMIKDLKAALMMGVSGGIGNAEEEDDADPTTAGSGGSGLMGPSTGSGSPAGATTPGRTSGSPSPGAAPGSSSPGASPSSGGASGPTSTGGPTIGQSVGNIFNKLRPADGWMAGVGRVLGRPFRDLGRYIKKNWYNEHKVLIEMMFIEHQADISDLLDRFEQELLAWFDQRAQEIFKDTGIGGAGITPSAAPSPTSPTATPVSSKPGAPGAPAGQDLQTVGTQAEKAAQGIEPAVISGNSPVAQAAEDGNPDAQEQVHQHYENLMAGLQAIGLGTTLTRGWGKHRGQVLDNPSLKRPGSVITVDGRPISDLEVNVFRHGKPVADEQGNPVKKKIGTSATELLREVVRRIYVNVFKQDPDNPNLKSGRFPEAIFNYISTQLPGGLSGNLRGGSKSSLILELLLKVGAMKTGSAHTPKPIGPTPTPGAPPTSAAQPAPTVSPSPAASPSAATPEAPVTPAATSNRPITDRPEITSVGEPEPEQSKGDIVVNKFKKDGTWPEIVKFFRTKVPGSYPDDESVETAVKAASEDAGVAEAIKWLQKQTGIADRPVAPPAAATTPTATSAPLAKPTDLGTAASTQERGIKEEPAFDKERMAKLGRIADSMVRSMFQDPGVAKTAHATLGDPESVKDMVVDLLGKAHFNIDNPNEVKAAIQGVKTQIQDMVQALKKAGMGGEDAEDSTEGPSLSADDGIHTEDKSLADEIQRMVQKHPVGTSQLNRYLTDKYEELMKVLLGDPDQALEKAAERADEFERETDDQDAKVAVNSLVKDLLALNKQIRSKKTDDAHSADADEFSQHINNLGATPGTPVATEAPAAAKPSGGGLSSVMRAARGRQNESLQEILNRYRQLLKEDRRPPSPAQQLRDKLKL